MILVGDIGGTTTVLGLCERNGTDLDWVREASFASAGRRSLEEILAEFLGGDCGSGLEAACFAIAGRVHQGRVHTTNLPWEVRENSVAQLISSPRVKFLNDLQAAAYGMLYLRPADFDVLQAGAVHPHAGDIAVIAPGTGLGEAIVHWDGERYHPLASEGGHADFAPRSDLEIDLLKHLRARIGGHVSYERVLSGPGIHALYLFLRERSGEQEPPWLRERLAHGDPNAVISKAGLAAEDDVCGETLALFASILGAEAGNLALRSVPEAGIVLGGGIPPKILPSLRRGRFLEAFSDKGRFSEWLRGLSVRVAHEPRAPLIGAAHFIAESPASGTRVGA